MNRPSDKEPMIEDLAFDDLVDEIAGCFQRGEYVDVSALMKTYPQHATRIGEVLPTLRLLSQLDESQPHDGPLEGASESPRVLGDFRIIRELGRGGMGVVYEAEQISLGRPLALKVLPFAAVMDPRAVIRFRNESRAAATLNHPHIVPVYSVGQERGIYYYAMGLVDGLTLSQVLEQLRTTLLNREKNPGRLRIDDVMSDHVSLRSDRSTSSETGPAFCHTNDHHAGDTNGTLQAVISTRRTDFDRHFFENVARLGCQVADALEHAHQHGIVHRDIKPGNLMLDTTSKVWITDFGLARIEGDASMTVSGDLVGTLRYMSPEQSLGQRHLVDHRADIYALGATLYELLTLRPAFDATDRRNLLRQIAFEDPPPPRKINPAVPPELETIVMKAMAKPPEERYESAQELADDFRAFADHRPILARPPTLLQRASKWCVRHQRAVAVGVGLLVLASAGLLTSTLVIARQRNEALEARALADERKVAAELAEEKEKQQRLEAQRQRRAAEENFRQVQHVVDAYLTKVSEDHLLNAPSLQPLRSELLGLALRYYEDFVQNEAASPAVRAEYADAHERLARITEAIGSPADALSKYQAALAIREELVHDEPEAAGHRRALAATCASLGVLHLKLGQRDEALSLADRSISVASALVEENRNEPANRITLAKAYRAQGRLLAGTIEFERCIASHRKSFEHWQAVAGDEGPYQHELARSELELGAALIQVWRAKKRQALYQSGITLQLRRQSLQLVPREDGTARGRRHLLHAVQRHAQLAAQDSTLERQFALAQAYMTLGEHEPMAFRRLPNYQKALSLLTRLAEENPRVLPYRAALGTCYRKMGQQLGVQPWRKVEGDPRDPADALAALKRAHSILQRLATEYPGVTEYQRELGETYAAIASHYAADPKLRQKAKVARERAREVWAQLVDAGNPTVQDRVAWGRAHHGLGSLYLAEGDPERALDALSSCLNIVTPLTERHPSVLRAKHLLQACLSVMGDAHARLGEEEGALAARLRAAALQKSLVDAGLHQYSFQLAKLCSTIARSYQERGQAEEAAAWYQRKVDLGESMFVRDGTTCFELAQTCAGWDQFRHRSDDAPLKRAIHLCSYGILIGPRVPELYRQRSVLYRRLGCQEQAEQDLEHAIRLAIPEGNFIELFNLIDACHSSELVIKVCSRALDVRKQRRAVPRDLVAYVHAAQAHAYGEAGERELALADCQTAEEILDGLPKHQQSGAALVWGRLGGSLYRLGELDRAEHCLQKCVQLLGEESPTLKNHWWTLAMLRYDQGKFARAREIYAELSAQLGGQYKPRLRERSQEVAAKLEVDAPETPAAQPAAPSAAWQGVEQERKAFVGFMEQLVENRQALAENAPADVQLRFRLAVSHRLLGRAQQQAGRSADAIASLTQSVSLLVRLTAESVEAPAGFPACQVSLSSARMELAAAHERQQDVPRAMKIWREVVDAQLTRNARKPLPVLVADLGLAHYHLDELGDAKIRFEQVIELLEEEQPRSDRYYWWYLTSSLHRLGETDRATTLDRELVEDATDQLALAAGDTGATLCGNVGQAYYRLGDWAAARRWLERSISLWGDDQPTTRRGHRWWYLAMTLHQLGETQHARSIYQQLLSNLQEPLSPATGRISAQAESLLGSATTVAF